MLMLLIMLQVKHLIFDFLFQPPWMYKNKGTLGHPGGVAHAAFHAVATFPLLVFFAPKQPLDFIFIFVCGGEFWIHYFVDWGKMNINRLCGWGPTTSENFWRLLGFDQFLHQLTYILIVAIMFS